MLKERELTNQFTGIREFQKPMWIDEKFRQATYIGLACSHFRNLWETLGLLDQHLGKLNIIPPIKISPPAWGNRGPNEACSGLTNAEMHLSRMAPLQAAHLGEKRVW